MSLSLGTAVTDLRRLSGGCGTSETRRDHPRPHPGGRRRGDRCRNPASRGAPSISGVVAGCHRMGLVVRGSPRVGGGDPIPGDHRLDAHLAFAVLVLLPDFVQVGAYRPVGALAVHAAHLVRVAAQVVQLDGAGCVSDVLVLSGADPAGGQRAVEPASTFLASAAVGSRLGRTGDGFVDHRTVPPWSPVVIDDLTEVPSTGYGSFAVTRA